MAVDVVRDQAVVAVAEALDAQYDSWVPENGVEDLMYVPGRNIMGMPPALLDIAGVAVDALRMAGWTPPSGDNTTDE